MGGFIVHSPYWNPACGHQKRVDHLKSINDEYGLLIDNNITVTNPDLEQSGILDIYPKADEVTSGNS